MSYKYGFTRKRLHTNQRTLNYGYNSENGILSINCYGFRALAQINIYR